MGRAGPWGRDGASFCHPLQTALTASLPRLQTRGPREGCGHPLFVAALPFGAQTPRWGRELSLRGAQRSESQARRGRPAPRGRRRLLQPATQGPGGARQGGRHGSFLPGGHSSTETPQEPGDTFRASRVEPTSTSEPSVVSAFTDVEKDRSGRRSDLFKARASERELQESCPPPGEPFPSGRGAALDQPVSPFAGGRSWQGLPTSPPEPPGTPAPSSPVTSDSAKAGSASGPALYLRRRLPLPIFTAKHREHLLSPGPPFAVCSQRASI